MPTRSVRRPTSGWRGQGRARQHGGHGLYQPVDLGIARRMMVAVRKASTTARGGRAHGAGRDEVRADRARAFRAKRHARRSHQAVRFDGARATRQSRRCDRRLVSTGSALKANGLTAVGSGVLSARLIVNQASLKLKRGEVSRPRRVQPRSRGGPAQARDINRISKRGRRLLAFEAAQDPKSTKPCRHPHGREGAAIPPLSSTRAGWMG